MHRGPKFCLFWLCATVANCSQQMGYTVGLGQNKQNFAASMHDLGPFLLLALAVS